MEQILESVSRIIRRWVSTSTPLTSNASKGDTILHVENSSRFSRGEEITIHDGNRGENPCIRISSIPDNASIELESPIRFNWRVSDGCVVQKTYMGMFVQGVYIGEQPVIPKYPAIEIVPLSRNSQWMTFGTTREKRNFEINIYADQETKENGTRFIIRMSDIIQKGLKKNIFPLVGEYDIIDVRADVLAEDDTIRVQSTSLLQTDQLVILENKYRAEELRVCSVLDSNTVQVFPLVHNDYLVSEDAKIIILNRFLFNSWPSDIQFGVVSKGTLLNAAKIQWFCEEQEVQTRGGWSDPNLS